MIKSFVFLRSPRACKPRPVLSLLVALFGVCPALLQAAPTITEFNLGPFPTPVDITAGPDGNLWATDFGSQVYRITPGGVTTTFSAGFSSGAGLNQIVAGADGNLWFSDRAGGKIGRITPAGAVVEFSQGITGRPYGITAGQDGNIWFTEYDAGLIGRITPSGVVTEFSVGAPSSGLLAITTGPDGYLWFIQGNRIAKMAADGVVAQTFSVEGAQLSHVTAGADGNIWFAANTPAKIGRIDRAGAVTLFTTGLSSGAYITRMTAGPDGNVWFSESFTDKVGRITPDGVIAEYDAARFPGSSPTGMSLGPDGNLWFVSPTRHSASRINLPRYLVNDLGDTHDAVPGDGTALDANGKTTLRAALEEANAKQDEYASIAFAPGLNGVISLTLGELPITSNLRIVGPGPASLKVDAQHGTRVFNVASATTLVTLQDLAISGGTVIGTGGGILSQGGMLALLRCHLTDNTATSGGGLASSGTGAVSITACALTANFAQSGGGIYWASTGQLKISNTTVSSNSTTRSNGGGLQIVSSGSTVLTNATFSGNSAIGQGGGIYSNNGLVVVANSILAGNTAPGGGPDVFTSVSNGFVGNGKNFIGDPTGSGAFANDLTFASTNSTLATLLGPWADHGGGTPSHRLPPGSPAIDQGSSSDIVIEFPSAPPFALDQRGLPRRVKGNPLSAANPADIGAYEVQLPAPPTFNGLPLTGLVLSARNAPLDLAGPSVGASPSGGTFSGPKVVGNFFDSGAAGPGLHFITYTLPTVDGYGNSPVATFAITVEGFAQTVVSNTQDDGPGSLRWAVRNLESGGTIRFSDGTDSSTNFQDTQSETIVLTSGEVILDKAITIKGPGANRLAVDGNRFSENAAQRSRVFSVEPATRVTISGLTIQNGNGHGTRFDGHGGGILNAGGRLSLTECLITGCAATSGAGIMNYGHFSNASLFIFGSTLWSNVATTGDGGGIVNLGDNGDATLSLVNSTLTRNIGVWGGGIYNHGIAGTAEVELRNCTLAWNIASAGGNLQSRSSNGGIAKVSLGNTILALPGGREIFRGENYRDDNSSSQASSLGGNLCDDGSARFLTAASDQPNQPSGLTLVRQTETPLLADNGGAVPTIGLEPDSAAINAGLQSVAVNPVTNSFLLFDQRGPGFARFASQIPGGPLQVDSGAFEYGGSRGDVVFTTGAKALEIDVLANDFTGIQVIAIVSPPQFGSARIVNGRVLYVPRGALPLDGDSFTYSYRTGNGGIAISTVTLVNFRQVAGNYDGLVEAAGQVTAATRHERSGHLRVTLNPAGTFTGRLMLAGDRLNPVALAGSVGYPFYGKLDATGAHARVILRGEQEAINLDLQFEPLNRTIVGRISSSDSAGSEFTSPVTLEPQTRAGLANSPQAPSGRYTLWIRPESQVGAPEGTGFATASLTPAGAITLTGKLADGKAWSSSTYLHRGDSFAVYTGLYSGAPASLGSLGGTLTFQVPTPDSPIDAIGTLAWFKPVRPKDVIFPFGFAATCVAELGRYRRPVRTRLLAFDEITGRGEAYLAGAGLTPITQPFTLSKTNLAAPIAPNPSRFSLRFTVSTGFFSGSFRLPESNKNLPFQGVIFQGTESGAGYFIHPVNQQSGYVDLYKN